MANKQALRDLQSRLAERLQAARTQERTQSWLAVECGGRGFVLPLREAGEIYPVAPLQAVPHSQRWFAGVANLRGHLHGVVDLAGFLGLKAHATHETGRDPSRLVGFNQALEINTVLLVDRLAGLRGDTELTTIDEPAPASQGRPAFVGARLRDAAGREWQELLLAELARDDTFLMIVG